MKLRRRSKQEVGKCVRVFSFSFVGLSPFSVVVSTSLPVGRHELPVDRSASLFVGPYGILWSCTTSSLSCSTTSTAFCIDATAIHDVSPLSSSGIIFFTGGSLDDTYVWLSSCMTDDATRSMSSASLGTIDAIHHDDPFHSTTADYWPGLTTTHNKLPHHHTHPSHYHRKKYPGSGANQSYPTSGRQPAGYHTCQSVHYHCCPSRSATSPSITRQPSANCIH